MLNNLARPLICTALYAGYEVTRFIGKEDLFKFTVEETTIHASQHIFKTAYIGRVLPAIF